MIRIMSNNASRPIPAPRTSLLPGGAGVKPPVPRRELKPDAPCTAKLCSHHIEQHTVANANTATSSSSSSSYSNSTINQIQAEGTTINSCRQANDQHQQQQSSRAQSWPSSCSNINLLHSQSERIQSSSNIEDEKSQKSIKNESKSHESYDNKKSEMNNLTAITNHSMNDDEEYPINRLEYNQRTSTISVNSIGGNDLFSTDTSKVINFEANQVNSKSHGNDAGSMHDIDEMISPSGNDYSTIATIATENENDESQGLIIGPNGGIWNPGYIGLDEYQRMIGSSSKPAFSNSKWDVTNYDQEANATSLYWDNELNQVKSGRFTNDHSYIAGWATVTVCKKSRGKLWITLEKKRLTGWSNQDKEGDSCLGPYQLSNLGFIGKNSNGSALEFHIRENLHCSQWINLKLSMSNDLDIWALTSAKCFMPNTELLSYCLKSLTAAGSVWIRQGSACAWSRGWMFLSEHKLHYMLDNCTMLFELDVRKFIGLKSNISKVDWCASVVGSLRGPFMLLQEGGSLFVQAENDVLTTSWIDTLKRQMECTGNRLEDCKLTVDDVPVIVDKCIKFISTYGLFHSGLYRRNGSAVESRLLLNDLRKDPNSVHLMVGSDDMINVVADVLRSFFRQLDSPLVPYFVQERLFAVSNIHDDSKFDEYHEILSSLPRIRLQTLRRLIDHLKDVTEHAQHNLATIENIAKVFGPTIFSVDHDNQANVSNSNFGFTIQQVNLLKDLLLHYAIIFRVSIREMTIKNKMSILQEKCSHTKVRADGFLVPIHILEKDNHTFNVQSSSTAEQVCEAARSRPVIRHDSGTADFALFEAIKCGQLERRVNALEKMSSMVTDRWLDWEPIECFLIFKRDTVPFSYNHLYPFADEVKIAEPGTKSFSTGHLKLEGGLVAHYSKTLKKLNEWHSDDILWYMGSESQRKPPYPYTLTFILLGSNFKYKAKYMGYCVAFRDNSTRTQWLNAVISSQQNFRDTSKMPLVQL